MSEQEFPTKDLPFITAGLPGISGQIKAEPGHFVVEELPVYEPSGQGDHIFVHFTREGWTTRAILQSLADTFSLRDVDLGCAGQKDKQARVTQTVSLMLPVVPEEEVAKRIEDSLPVKVHWARRHNKKLKTGHLLGNRFTIIFQTGEEDALARARETALALHERGLPNYYGRQRFGMKGDNAERGRDILLKGGGGNRWLTRFLLSAYQSQLFNLWLSERIGRGWFDQILTGDVAKKTATGGIFDVEDADIERPRFTAGEITYTGPIYGAQMRWAGGEPGDLERSVMEQAGLTEANLRRARLDGSRRTARLIIEGLSVEPHPLGLAFTFCLPKGSYATTVLREFTKDEEPILSDEE